MRIYDILEDSACKQIFNEVQSFVEDILSQYNESLDISCLEGKDIFDFVWGTINFSAAEICILDSPLLQRLRRIKQLGLADLVYCNANSSRFSHTLGVTEVAARMATIVSEELGSSEAGQFDAIEIVRLAAIFHDVGHMFFSHVSESYFTYNNDFPRYKEITAALSDFSEKTSTSVSLHELISVMIVNSLETKKLLNLVSKLFKKTRLHNMDDCETLVEYISCLIIGSPIDKFIYPYSMIINSSIDADKLDYLSRDSACTRIPIAVDIPRIIQKLGVVSIKNKVQFSKIWKDSTNCNDSYKIMAIKRSASKAFWQLSSARSSMYDSVYYHHKVLTAETMFRDFIHQLYKLDCSSTILTFDKILSITDDSFNDYWEYSLFPYDKIKNVDFTSLSKVLKNIRNRHLFKRVAAFSKDILHSENISDIKDFFTYIIQNPISQECDDFFKELKVTYFEICKTLKISDETTTDFLFVCSKYEPMPAMAIEHVDDDCMWSSSMLKQETIEAGKKSKQELFYLISNSPHRDIAFLALEKTLLNYGITVSSREASLCSKISNEKLDSLRWQLFELDYYKDSLCLLSNNNLYRIVDSVLLENIVSKFQSYQGANTIKINEGRLVKFLRQFLYLNISHTELTQLLNGVLLLLQNSYYLDRESFSKEAPALMNKLLAVEKEDRHLVLSGGIFDSAHHLSYYLNDLSSKLSFIYDKDIETALDKITHNAFLCFFDDAAYSGKQIVSIFQELMGVAIEKRETSESHVEELSHSNKEKLKKANIILAYIYFNTESEKYIKSKFAELGLNNVNIYYVKDLSKKLLEDQNLFSDPKQEAVVKKYIKQIGYEILKNSKTNQNGSYKEHWNEDRVNSSALGYNDAQQMVIFNTNVPTYTISLFWVDSTYKERKWIGLFSRTVKD